MPAPGTQRVSGKGLIAAQCSSCGGILSLNNTAEATCDYCGNKFFVSDSYKNRDADSQVSRFFELAYSSQSANNADEAYQYFTKILEVKTDEALAWFGRGCSALGKSTGLSIDVDTAFVCFDKALSYAKDKDGMKKEISKTCYHYGIMIFQWLSRNWWFYGDVRAQTISLLVYGDDKYNYSDKQLEYIIDSILYLLYWNGVAKPDKITHLDTIRSYTERIRKVNKKYLNPIEKARRILVISLVVISAVAIALIIIAVVKNSH